MKFRIAAALVFFVAGAGAANAQTMPTPVPPPVSAAPPPPPASGLSPILTQPWLAQQPFRASPAAQAPPSSSPLDQQKMQSYRNDLIGRQRALEQQGVSPGAEPYRTNQQQLNQLNGSSR
jgi:hypothetical protein